jgi:hypothetical protein
MKKILYLFIAIYVLLNTSLVQAGNANGRGNYGTAPQEVLYRVVGEANIENKIQDTQLDRISADADMQFSSEYKIANTLNSIRIKIAPYLQWFMFIGLSVATILIIITWFQLVTSVQSGEDTKKAQGRIKNIVIGLLIMTGFYIITRIIMSLLAYMLQ